MPEALAAPYSAPGASWGAAPLGRTGETVQAETSAQELPINYYLVDWQWQPATESTFGYWTVTAPGEIGRVDFRPLAAQAIPGGPDQCCALVATTETLTDYRIYLATGLDGTVFNVDQLATRFGITGLTSDRLRKFLLVLIQRHGSADGTTPWKPLLPDANGIIELNIGPHRVFRVKLDKSGEYFQQAMKVHQADYEVIKAESIARGDLHYLKVAGYWRDKYGFDIRTVEQQADGILDPETTITESFNTADSDTLGPDLTWAEDLRDLDIVSNKAAVGDGLNNFHTARATSVLSSEDHYTEVILSGVGFDAGPLARKANSSTQTFYLAAARDSFNDIKLWSVVSGTYSQIGTTYSGAVAPGDTLRITANASTITASQNGTDRVTTSSITITGNLTTGIWAYDSSSELDSFEAADLSTASTRRIIVVD